MPSTISVLLPPRVSFCAVATPATASAPTITAAAIRIFIARSFFSLALSVHGVDDILVLRADERPLQLHGRRQLLVVGSEDLLDEAELLDGLDPRELRSEEHTSELQSLTNLVCRLLLEKKK